MKNLSPSEPVEDPKFAYPAITITNLINKSNFPYQKIYFKDKIITIDEDGNKKYYNDTQKIGRWLIDLGNKYSQIHSEKEKSFPWLGVSLIVLTTIIFIIAMWWNIKKD